MEIKISIAELLDKISILELKKMFIVDTQKLININYEYEYLIGKSKSIFNDYKIDFYGELFNINKELWEVEDALRIKEKKIEFDQEFIELARKVYILNDNRAYVKKKINLKYNSEIIEEKSYVE